MSENSPSAPESRQLFLRRLFGVILAGLRAFGRRRTWTAIFSAVDFLLSNEIYTYASAIAFNVLIAFFPAVIVVLTVIHQIAGPGLHDAAVAAVTDYLPSNRAFFAAQINGVTNHFSGMTFVSLAILLFSAVGIFIPVELALNYVWKEPKPRHWFVSQVISFFLLGLFILVSLVPVALSWAAGLALETVFFFLSGTAFLAGVKWLVFKVLTVPFTILGFAVVFAVLPNRKLNLEEVVPAAIFSGVCFELGKYVYIAFLPLLGFREIYGAFFVSVTFVTWALFASLIMLMGVYLTTQDILPRFRFRRGASPAEMPGGANAG